MRIIPQLLGRPQEVQHGKSHIVASALLVALIFGATLERALGRENSEDKSKHIRTISAEYDDKTTPKTCSPDLSICKEATECSFQFDDDLCSVDAPIKNLEVWDCGPGATKKARAEGKKRENFNFMQEINCKGGASVTAKQICAHPHSYTC